ncbi:MAG: hypothetical protein P1V36_04030 [Planctomycetota bacterium]|nr:hypothetical protein [Planctomycetota bacterium]
MLPVFLTLATLVAVGLMVAVLLRMGRRHDDLQAEFERLKVVQRDMSTDVRTRLDEGSKTWEAVESEVKPKLQQLEALEPSVADLSAALAENLPALSDARQRLEAVEERTTGTESRVTAALEANTSEAGERFERIEEAVRTLRNAADERLADLAGRVTSLEDRTPEATSDSPLEDTSNRGADEPVLVTVGAGRAPQPAAATTPPPIPASSARSAVRDSRNAVRDSRNAVQGETGSRSAGAGTAASGTTDASGKGSGTWVLIMVAVAIGLVALVVTL